MTVRPGLLIAMAAALATASAAAQPPAIYDGRRLVDGQPFVIAYVEHVARAGRAVSPLSFYANAGRAL